MMTSKTPDSVTPDGWPDARRTVVQSNVGPLPVTRQGVLHCFAGRRTSNYHERMAARRLVRPESDCLTVERQGVEHG